jgi:hypothetical protein
MQHENDAARQVVATHPDGRRAVVQIKVKAKPYYEAFGSDGLSVGVFDRNDEAVSAAQWAYDFQEEDPSIRRLTLMQLVMDKLTLQYPLDSAAVTLAPKG